MPKAAALNSPGTGSFTYREITKKDFPLIAELFGEKGACSGCWCMWWRSPLTGKAYHAEQGEGNRAAFQALIEQGVVNGILAFDGEGKSKTPVGWCTFGPRTDFPRLNRTMAYVREDTEQVWSIPCFYISRGFRSQGVARGLLKAAMAAIGRGRNVIIEGYPVPLTKAGERLPATFAFTGPLPLFTELGFQMVQRTSHSRPLVQRHTSPESKLQL